MELKDLDTITLKEGETLILRPKKHWPNEALVRLAEHARAKGLNVMIVGHEFEMFVGVNVKENVNGS